LNLHPQPQTGAETSHPDPGEAQLDPILFCPACSRRLTEHRCKLVCDECGYYMSCADYY